MLGVDREVSVAYLDRLRAHAQVKAEMPPPVRSAKGRTGAPKLTVAHDKHRLAAQAVPIDELTGTNASRANHPKQGLEEFRVNGDWGVGCQVTLHTRDLGSPGSIPTELLVAWNIESSSIKEDNGGNPATRMVLKKR